MLLLTPRAPWTQLLAMGQRGTSEIDNPFLVEELVNCRLHARCNIWQ